ncbi:hypothetical protein L615_003200000200 [Nocardioides sp. J9]|nr:hypothetical protein L615_003200000200 [Nocardioides sp. J9]
MTETMFTEPEERVALREAVTKLAARYGREFVEKQAREGGKMTEMWLEMGSAGFLGVNIPEEFGGGGGGMADLAAVLEETAAAGTPLLMMVVSPAICGSIISRCGTDEQKKRWLPGIADGTHLMAFGITEADAGSNSHKITTTAERDGDTWVLKGQKTFISGVDEAQSVLIVARTADARTGKLKPALFVVPTDAEGFTKQPIPMSWSAPEKQFTLFLDDVRLPADALVGDEDGGGSCSRASTPSASWARPCRAAWPATPSTRPSATPRSARSGRTSRSAPTRASRTRWRR